MKRFKLAGIAVFMACMFLLFQNLTYPETFDLYISATGGSDANSGRTYTASIRTFDKAHSILQNINPKTPIRIFVGGGNYYCRGLKGVWTYSNGQPITIESLNAVPGPAVESRDDSRRPVFYGKNIDGSLCEKSIWFDLMHSGQPMNITFKGLKLIFYRGGITIRQQTNSMPKISQNISVLNMVFERIGDLYYDSSTVGKGALLVSYTSGMTIKDSQFDQIRNKDLHRGLIHSIYFSSAVSKSLIENNNFHGNSGAAIKLTHYSNLNMIKNNRFSYVATSIVDRWCGARETDDIERSCPDGVPQCPSWDNDFSQGNISTALELPQDAIIYPIPYQQECMFPPTTSGIRMILSDRVIR